MGDARVRITSIDELQLLTCLRHQVWGSHSARFGDWHTGDYLAFIVDKALAGLAQVAGKPYTSKELIWDNGVYPRRLPLKFLHVVAPQDRPPILGAVRDALISAWGTRYGYGIRNQFVLPGEAAKIILSTVRSKPNGLLNTRANLEALMEDARAARDAAKK